MNKALAKFCRFLRHYAKSHPQCSKDEICNAAVEEFLLIRERSVFYCDEFAVRFSSVRGQSFSNGVLSLSSLHKYDHSPFVVCVVRYVVTCLASILDEKILSATRIQFHWAGRNSRGVTQLTGDLRDVFKPDFSETINVKRAQEFLQRLIELKPTTS